MDFHPIANVFPLMEGEEFKELVEDISANGQQQPIYLYEGMILDGRNRYRACVEANVEPWVEKWSGDDALEAVKSLNLHRRHLTAGQKAAAATELEELYAKQAKKRRDAKLKQNTPTEESAEVERIPQREKARDRAAADLNVNPHYVSDAKKLKAEHPETYESVKRGEISLPAAKREHETKRGSEAESSEPSVGELIGDDAEEVWDLEWDVSPEGKEYRNVVKWVDRVMKLDPEKIASYCRDDYEAGRDLEHVDDMIGWLSRYRNALEQRRKDFEPGNLRAVN